MPIEQARDEVASLCVDNFCLLSNGMTGIFANVGDVSVFDGDVCPSDDFALLNSDPLPVKNDRVRRDTSHGNVYQCASQFCR